MTRAPQTQRVAGDIIPALLERLTDTNRLVGYTAMIALAHQSRSDWFFNLQNLEKLGQTSIAALRALVAAKLRGDSRPYSASEEGTPWLLGAVLRSNISGKEARQNLLRALSVLRKNVEADPILTQQTKKRLLISFPDADRDIRWEQVRLISEYKIAAAFPRLLNLLQSEKDEVTQFHIAQCIAKLPGGWTPTEEERLLRWFVATQHGWFTEFAGKGVEFPDFWLTVLNNFGANHGAALLRDLSKVDFVSQLGSVAITLLSKQPNGDQEVIDLYRQQRSAEARLQIVRALKNVRTPRVSALLRSEWGSALEDNMRRAILESLAAQYPEAANLPVLIEGLRQRNVPVVRACVEALPACHAELDEPLANLLISLVIEYRSLYRPVQLTLTKLTPTVPPNLETVLKPDRQISEDMRKSDVEFWKDWYTHSYHKEFVSTLSRGDTEKSDEEIHRFLATDPLKGGNAGKGAVIYEALGCNACHGGGVTPGREGRIFGPDLAGVMRRLTRVELADALVYPSKQVADRFKAYEIELNDATPVTGFITEQNDQFVTVTDREQVHRIPRGRIRAITPQSTSLMPSNLLNRLGWEEIRDLIAFLEGNSPEPKPAAAR